jgi:hypothetical protein
VDTHSLSGSESDGSEDGVLPARSTSTRELERTPLERYAFLFRHDSSSSVSDLHELHPLPSQIPFLLNVYSENVNCFLQAVHMPTVTKMVRSMRSDAARPMPNNEALMFAIYYAAIISMEEEDVSLT